MAVLGWKHMAHMCVGSHQGDVTRVVTGGSVAIPEFIPRIFSHVKKSFCSTLFLSTLRAYTDDI